MKKQIACYIATDIYNLRGFVDAENISPSDIISLQYDNGKLILFYFFNINLNTKPNENN